MHDMSALLSTFPSTPCLCPLFSTCCNLSSFRLRAGIVLLWCHIVSGTTTPGVPDYSYWDTKMTMNSSNAATTHRDVPFHAYVFLKFLTLDLWHLQLEFKHGGDFPGCMTNHWVVSKVFLKIRKKYASRNNKNNAIQSYQFRQFQLLCGKQGDQIAFI